MTKKIEYSAIKKAFWEAWRAFWPSFAGVVALEVSTGSGAQDLKTWTKGVLVAALVAGVKAVAKWYRETYAKGDYSSLIYKLPL